MSRDPRGREGNGETAGRYAYQGLDRVLHEKARLGILTSLMARSDGLSFRDLRLACALTDGNLARHLQVLVESGHVELRKGDASGRPRTICRLTSAGRQRFVEYLAELEKVIRDAHASEHRARQTRGETLPAPGTPPGWVPA